MASVDGTRVRHEPCFVTCSLLHGRLRELENDPFPSVVSAWCDDRFDMAHDATHFGYVQAGQPTLDCASGSFRLSPGMYFAVPGTGSIGGSGKGLIISRLEYGGFFQLGGPVEQQGRLQYIDGCTDSLLISPAMRGDACLNLLCIPPGTDQTPHTHPSHRVGLIVRGEGSCITPEGTTPLVAGTVFVIRAGGLHSFHTDTSELAIIAYHPDSDFGPTHENHPMLNRTIVGGNRT